MLDHEV